MLLMPLFAPQPFCSALGCLSLSVSVVQCSIVCVVQCSQPTPPAAVSVSPFSPPPPECIPCDDEAWAAELQSQRVRRATPAFHCQYNDFGLSGSGPRVCGAEDFVSNSYLAVVSNAASHNTPCLSACRQAIPVLKSVSLDWAPATPPPPSCFSLPLL